MRETMKFNDVCIAMARTEQAWMERPFAEIEQPAETVIEGIEWYDEAWAMPTAATTSSS